MPITSHKFGSIDPISGKETDDDNGQFVSSVCWRGKSDMVVAASSSGCIKVLQLVWGKLNCLRPRICSLLWLFCSSCDPKVFWGIVHSRNHNFAQRNAENPKNSSAQVDHVMGTTGWKYWLCNISALKHLWREARQIVTTDSRSPKWKMRCKNDKLKRLKPTIISPLIEEAWATALRFKMIDWDRHEFRTSGFKIKVGFWEQLCQLKQIWSIFALAPQNNADLFCSPELLV